MYDLTTLIGSAFVATVGGTAVAALALKVVKRKYKKYYAVHYHKGFSGRAQGLDLMLSYARRDWKRVNGKPDDSVFALPAVVCGKRVLSQTTAIAQWLGNELQLAPPEELAPEAMKFALDIADIWSEAYGKRNNLPSVKAMEEFIGVIEAQFQKFSRKGSPFAFGGERPSYVDFLLLNVAETIEFMYGKKRAAVAMSKSPAALACCQALRNVPVIAKALAVEPVLYSGASEENLPSGKKN